MPILHYFLLDFSISLNNLSLPINFLSIYEWLVSLLKSLLSCIVVVMLLSDLLHMWLLLNVRVLHAFLVEELAVLEVVVGVVTGHGVGRHLLVGVSEVDVPHVILIVQHIGVVGVGVPEDV